MKESYQPEPRPESAGPSPETKKKRSSRATTMVAATMMTAAPLAASAQEPHQGQDANRVENASPRYHKAPVNLMTHQELMKAGTEEVVSGGDTTRDFKYMLGKDTLVIPETYSARPEHSIHDPNRAKHDPAELLKTAITPAGDTEMTFKEMVDGQPLAVTEIYPYAGTAQNKPVLEPQIVHDPRDKSLESYQDSLALWRYYHTQAKYLGVDHIEPFDTASYGADESRHIAGIVGAINDMASTAENQLRNAYENKQISETEYLQKMKLVDTLKPEEFGFAQAMRLIESDKRKNEQELEKKKGTGIAKRYYMKAGQLFNKYIRPSGQFRDKKGDAHPIYEHPVQEVRYEPEQDAGGSQ